jgi:hypothetical protein
MTVISVDLSNAPYDIHVRAGLLADAGRHLMPFARDALLPVEDYPHSLRHAAQLDALPHWRDPFAGLA